MAINTDEQVIQILRENLYLDVRPTGGRKVEIRLMSRNMGDTDYVGYAYEIDSVEIDLDQ